MWEPLSPSGRYEITVHEHEAFNTHWVLTPTIRDKQTGDTVFAFQDSRWSLDEGRWSGDSVVRLTVRKYPGNHRPGDVVAVIDCDARTGTVGDEPHGPLSGLEPRLDRALAWIHAGPEEREPAPSVLAAIQRFLRGG